MHEQSRSLLGKILFQAEKELTYIDLTQGKSFTYRGSDQVTLTSGPGLAHTYSKEVDPKFKSVLKNSFMKTSVGTEIQGFVAYEICTMVPEMVWFF